MNRLLALALCLPFAITSIAGAQEKKPPATTPAPAATPASKSAKHAEPPTKKDEAKKDAAVGAMADDKPGEMHKLLEAFEGDWQATSIGYDNGKAGTPEKGTMKAKVEFGGRFLHADYNGRAHGQFFHGEGFTGYNNATKRFEMCWVETQSTGVTMMTGQFDASKKVLTMTGEMTMAGDKKVPMRTVSTIVDKGTIKDEFYMTMGGKESKMMEITYTKGSASESEKKEEKKNEKK